MPSTEQSSQATRPPLQGYSHALRVSVAAPRDHGSPITGNFAPAISMVAAEAWDEASDLA